MLRNQCGKRRYSCQIVPLSKRFPVRLPRRQVFEEIRHLASPAMPFVNLPDTHKSRWGDELTAEKTKECVWLRPEAVAQIEFLEWTEADRLRHSKFVGLREVREDKNPRDVVKEV